MNTATKQLLLDIIGLTYQMKLDWKLVKHKADTITRDLVPAGKYFLHDTPGHSSDIYVRIGWLGQLTEVYVFRHEDWSRRSVQHVPIYDEDNLKQELFAAIHWSHQEFTRRQKSDQILKANQLVGDIIRSDAQDGFTQALKGLK